MAADLTMLGGHKDYGNVGWPGRKTDPTYDMDWRRRRVAVLMAATTTPPPKENDDMPYTEKQLREIVRDAVRAELAEPMQLVSPGARRVLNAGGQPGQAWSFRHLMEVIASNVVAVARRG